MQARTFFQQEIIFFFQKTRHAISCAVNFYNAGFVTRDRRIDSKTRRPHPKATLSMSSNFYVGAAVKGISERQFEPGLPDGLFSYQKSKFG
jgi:hypothetical protein